MLLYEAQKWKKISEKRSLCLIFTVSVSSPLFLLLLESFPRPRTASEPPSFAMENLNPDFVQGPKILNTNRHFVLLVGGVVILIIVGIYYSTLVANQGRQYQLVKKKYSNEAILEEARQAYLEQKKYYERKNRAMLKHAYVPNPVPELSAGSNSKSSKTSSHSKSSFSRYRRNKRKHHW